MKKTTTMMTTSGPRTSQVPPLTEAQLKVLSHGPNFAVVPRHPPVGKYITFIEHAYSKLKQGEVDELRGEMKAILKKGHPKYNITKEEQKALAELQKDKSRIILTADKGVSIVVMDREDYTRKAEELLD